MAKKFKELESRMSPESISKSDEKYRQLKSEMALEEVRDARRLTQEQLAQTLKVDQSAISKLERRTDMYVSTLGRYIEAMGGRLEIRAIFQDQSVMISQFGNLAAKTRTSGSLAR